MATDSKPTKLTLRAYQVGFGDCFLLTFHYPSKERHVLIDFGSTGRPKGSDPKLMLHVAEDIEKECGGKLHAVVATHRHKDHISGFATSKGKASGDVIARCKPDVVIQPWTEDPKAQPDARDSTTLSRDAKQHFTASLQSMHEISAAVLVESQSMRRQNFSASLVDQLDFLGDDNLTNRSAVENLMQMGKRNFYVHYGTKSGLESVLPGVKTHVLGPPNLKQSNEIRNQSPRDEKEYWHFQAMAGNDANVRGGTLFPGARSVSGNQSAPNARWFIRKLRSIRGQQLLGLVRTLDQAMNNTSLIFLFEVGKKRFLFSGDAQIENWRYALAAAEEDKKLAELLKNVTLYKVGHHGSLNATPKTLWDMFAKRSPKQTANRLQTVVSTMAGKHGETAATAVPRATLVKELKAESDYFSTQQLRGKSALRKDFVIKL